MKRLRKNHPRRFSPGFTMLELLVVVGVIAILAAIAVYNLSEAQTRARTSRAKAEMRTIATALESYAVDYNDYPPNAFMPPDDPAQLVFFPPGSGLSFTPPQLTTPVAYISQLPEDPFKIAAGDIYGVGSISAMGRRGYDYYRIITPSEWLSYQNGSVTGVQALISFVAVHSEGPVAAADGRLVDFGNRGAFGKYGHWLQWSIGPDHRPWDWSKDFQETGDPASPLKEPPFDPNYYSFDVNYDPTNGVVSFGNIHRTQVGIEGFAFDAGGPPGAPADPAGVAGIDPNTGGPSGPGGGGPPNGGSGGGGLGGGALPTGNSSRHSSSRHVEVPPLPGDAAKIGTAPRQVDVTAPDAMSRLIEKFPGSGYKRTRKERLRWPDLREISALLLLIGLVLLMLYVIYRMLRRPVITEEIFDGSIMDDNSLAYLAKLGPVKMLHLAESRVTDAGLKHVASMDSLESINLWGTQIGDEGLRHLRGLTGLRELILGGCRVTDNGLKSLLKMQNLEMLTLCGAPISDKSVAVLRRLKNLRILNLRGTHLSSRAIKELSMALPGCQIQIGEIEASTPAT